MFFFCKKLLWWCLKILNQQNGISPQICTHLIQRKVSAEHSLAICCVRRLLADMRWAKRFSDSILIHLMISYWCSLSAHCTVENIIKLLWFTDFGRCSQRISAFLLLLLRLSLGFSRFTNSFLLVKIPT